MLMPKRVKRRKQFRGTMAGKALRGRRHAPGIEQPAVLINAGFDVRREL